MGHRPAGNACPKVMNNNANQINNVGKAWGIIKQQQEPAQVISAAGRQGKKKGEGNPGGCKPGMGTAAAGNRFLQWSGMFAGTQACKWSVGQVCCKYRHCKASTRPGPPTLAEQNGMSACLIWAIWGRWGNGVRGGYQRHTGCRWDSIPNNRTPKGNWNILSRYNNKLYGVLLQKNVHTMYLGR